MVPLVASTTLYVFRCGGSNFYGYTVDPLGANLPVDMCTAGWTLSERIDMDSSRRIDRDLGMIVDDVRRKGYAYRRLMIATAAGRRGSVA